MSTGPFGPRIAALVEQLEKRIVVIDGAMGTMVQARKLGRPTTGEAASRIIPRT